MLSRCARGVRGAGGVASRRAGLLAALALTSLPLVLWPAPAPGLDDPARHARTTVLENGLTVLTLEDRTTPVVSFQMWVKVGSRDESRHTGLAHLFEHMMFKGSKHIGPEEHARLVQARGGRLNAFTTRDFTVYFEDVPPEALPLVIELEAERLAHLDISRETLESERRVVLEERRMRTEDRPGGRGIEALYALTYQAHPYRWPVIGWREDVATATVEVCRDFFATYYVPNNILIAVAGNFDTEDTLARIRRSFGGLEAREPVPRNPTREPAQTGERRATVHFDVESPLLLAAYHAPAAGHEDAEALDVASAILSSGRSSRLYRRLVDREQAALYAQGYYLEQLAGGVFYALASVRPGVEVAQVEASLFQELARLREEPVSEAELARAKTGLEVDFVNSLTATHSLAHRIAQETLLFGRIRPLDERLAAYRAVTAEDVRRVARTYLVDAGRNVVRVVAPPEPGS